MANPFIADESDSPRALVRTTIREQGKDEKFLENAIGAQPGLLGFDAMEGMVKERIKAFHQVELPTPKGSLVKPDILILSDRGEIVVVEVKLADNADWRDRSAIGQLIEYAASLASLDDFDLTKMLARELPADTTWQSAVASFFPKVQDSDRLAQNLLDNFKRARFHLVLACDKAPSGLGDLMRNATRQAALGDYQLRLVEIAPFLVSEGGPMVFLTTTAVKTEVVARTVVEVQYRASDARPGVQVIESVEPEAVLEAVARPRRQKPWTVGEFRQQLREREVAPVDAEFLTRALSMLERLEKDRVIRIDGGRGISAQVVARANEVNLMTFGTQPQVKLYTWSWEQRPTLSEALRRAMAAIVGPVFDGTREPDVLGRLREADPDLSRTEAWIRQSAAAIRNDAATPNA